MLQNRCQGNGSFLPPISQNIYFISASSFYEIYDAVHRIKYVDFRFNQLLHINLTSVIARPITWRKVIDFLFF